ncbi:MAG: DNA primase [Sedimentisphaerales bacterium]|nr:DNA primase [Sedimentisphaerales bacterium]
MPGVYDYATINQVQQANDIVDVVSEHVSLKKKGREMVGLCPFHEDHRPSMNVSPTKQIFKCFACGLGGDVLKFVQMRENLTFPQAVERLAERAGIQLKSVRRAAPPQDGESSNVDPNALARLNAWAVKFFQKSLNDPEKGKHARDYLTQRGISAESIEKWRLGLAPNQVDALARAARARNIPAELSQQGGLVTGPGQDKFSNRLMFPITDVTGRVCGFGGRTLNDTGAKYINSPTTPLFDKSHTLYGLEQSRHSIVSGGTAIVVEGYTDVIMAHQVGCSNVVAALGTSFTTGHGRMLRRYARKVVLVFDSDTAGMAAANRALEVCLAQRLDIELAFVPDGKDPCDFLLSDGKKGFDRILEQATDVLQFKWDRLKASFRTDDSLAGRRAALDEFLQAVATGLKSQNLPVLESGLLVNKVSRIVGLSPREINGDLSRRMQRLTRSTVEERPAGEDLDWGQGLYAVAQREVLEVLLNEPGLYHSVGEEITAELFDVPVLREIASTLLDLIRSDEDYSIGVLLARTESVPVSNCLMELHTVGERKGNYESRLVDSLKVLHRRCARGKTVQTDRTQTDDNVVEPPKKSVQRRNPYSIGLT